MICFLDVSLGNSPVEGVFHQQELTSTEKTMFQITVAAALLTLIASPLTADDNKLADLKDSPTRAKQL
jgi:hypothetical protein